jgi:hypothetical protein
VNWLKGKEVTCLRDIAEEDLLYVGVGVFRLFKDLRMGKFWEAFLKG